MQLRDAPAPVRLLATMFLIGAAATLFLGDALAYRSYAWADGTAGLSVADLHVSFTGGADSMLEARVRGEMRQYLRSGDELATILAWASQGADEPHYTASVAPLLEDRCVSCHSSTGRAGFRPLTTYEQVREVALAPPAPPLSRQLLVTKVHLAGISLLFGVTSSLLTLTETTKRLQGLLIAGVYGGLFLDFSSWWAMRLDLAFAWGRIFGNLVMVAAFAVTVAICLWELVWVPRRSS